MAGIIPISKYRTYTTNKLQHINGFNVSDISRRILLTRDSETALYLNSICELSSPSLMLQHTTYEKHKCTVLSLIHMLLINGSSFNYYYSHIMYI